MSARQVKRKNILSKHLHIVPAGLETSDFKGCDYEWNGNSQRETSYVNLLIQSNALE